MVNEFDINDKKFYDKVFKYYELWVWLYEKGC
jgi:hypothetical protein